MRIFPGYCQGPSPKPGLSLMSGRAFFALGPNRRESLRQELAAQLRLCTRENRKDDPVVRIVIALAPDSTKLADAALF